MQLLWPCTLIGVVLAVACAPRLNLINLGEDAARSLGVRIGALRLLVFVVSLLLVGASVCAVGPIGFVGLIAPNIARQWLGNDYRWLIPISAGFGRGHRAGLGPDQPRGGLPGGNTGRGGDGIDRRAVLSVSGRACAMNHPRSRLLLLMTLLALALLLSLSAGTVWLTRAPYSII